MLLNSWKEIAAYLKCGTRTAQRWHRDLRMPVIKVRDSERGPVFAESERLDEWMERRSSVVQLHKSSTVLTKQTQRTVELTRRSAEQGRKFLWIELSVGRQFVELALAAKNDETAARRKERARKAHDSIEHYFSFTKAMPQAEQNRFNAELGEFKSELQKLG